MEIEKEIRKIIKEEISLYIKNMSLHKELQDKLWEKSYSEIKKLIKEVKKNYFSKKRIYEFLIKEIYNDNDFIDTIARWTAEWLEKKLNLNVKVTISKDN